jgi:hypothetical protein
MYLRLRMRMLESSPMTGSMAPAPRTNSPARRSFLPRSTPYMHGPCRPSHRLRISRARHGVRRHGPGHHLCLELATALHPVMRHPLLKITASRTPPPQPSASPSSAISYLAPIITIEIKVSSPFYTRARVYVSWAGVRSGDQLPMKHYLNQ